jgi:hypothetical protein
MIGTGTLLDPYIIENVTDLQNIEDDLDAYYELGGDIDASATSGWNSGAGFAPITSFTGQLNGKGFAISSLFINRNASAVGLFNVNAGTVTNVGLTSCDITGASVGSIAYENTGTISKCYSTGAVKIGTLGGFAGGFIQWNTGTITNSYTRCTVTGQSTSFAGGFVQWNNAGTIDDCYSTGAVSGATFNAGFCQSNDTPTDITNCFWDTQTSGQASSDGGTGKTTTQMKTESTFTDAGWDFTTPVWYIQSTINVGYPNLGMEASGEGQGIIAIVYETLHYIGRSGQEYYIQGTPVS